jgi:hypothetical protein
MTAIASNASAVTSFVASLQIHGAAGAAAQITGTLTEQTQPSVLVQVQTAQPVGLAAILAGNTAYLKIGALTRMTGKPWVAVPYSGLTSGSSASLAPMIQEIQGTDPLAQTQMFPAAKDVRKVGAATINGVPTTEYSGSYSLAAGLAQLAQGLRAGVQSAMTANGITSTDFTVWVDAQHQVRKMSLVEFGRSARIEVILVIISINQPVRIQVPPAGEVVSSAVNPAPAPSMTPGTPAPAATMPAPAATPTPSPVTSQPPGGTPTPIATNSPNHW